MKLKIDKRKLWEVAQHVAMDEKDSGQRDSSLSPVILTELEQIVGFPFVNCNWLYGFYFHISRKLRFTHAGSKLTGPSMHSPPINLMVGAECMCS